MPNFSSTTTPSYAKLEASTCRFLASILAFETKTFDQAKAISCSTNLLTKNVLSFCAL